MGRGIVAVIASCGLLYGCATPWPQVMAKSDPAFAHRAQPIQKIDVLPIDLQLWVDDPDKRGSPQELRDAAEQELATAVLAGLRQKGYVDNAQIEWDGNFVAPDGHPAPALDHDAVAATVESLSTYGAAAARADRLPVPYLPAHLGDSTGGDATLYVGGWSFVGDNDADSGEIATYIVIGVVIVAAIVIIAIAASKSHGGGHDHGGEHARGGGGDGTGGIAHVGHFGSGHTVDHRGLPPMRAHHGGDAFGHSDTTLIYVDDRPDYIDEDAAPHDGHSQMYVEMTLVDNHTGLVLWHARQQFPASAARPAEIDRVVASLLATLPQAP